MRSANHDRDKNANSSETRDMGRWQTGKAMKSSILGFHLEYVDGMAIQYVEIDSYPYEKKNTKLIQTMDKIFNSSP